MNSKDYYFMEWLIIGKGIDNDAFDKLNDEEFTKLKEEYNNFLNTTNYRER